jgi:hypothetical protein
VITEPSVLVAEFSTGVEERMDQGSITVAPNPSTGVFTVRSSGRAITSVQVFASDGRQCFVGPTHTNATSLVLDLSHLDAGAYRMLVKDADHALFSTTILLLH